MKIILTLQLCVFLMFTVHSQYDGNTSPSYPDLIKIYIDLAEKNTEIELYNMGQSDFGLPIYLCIINGAQDSIKSFDKARESTTLLINNAIHPGEPDGVNACLIWINDWILAGKKTKNLPVIGIIPAYNVGGMMIRSSSSRANQDGPEEYGFRGNTQNLDLNRDFIKMDSRNMFTFAKIYHGLDPDVFIDTHVSNGADYQYTLTYIASVRERMGPELGSLMYEDMIPYLKKRGEKANFDMVPYVNLKGATPETGLTVFNDLPRYAMGYASLLNAISFTIETHMLKPFSQRVQSTLLFIEESINWMKINSGKIEIAREKTSEWERKMEYYPFQYKLQAKRDSILFKGYEFSNPISEVTGLTRLKYHQDKPYEKFIPLYKTYAAMDSLFIPDYYIVGGECSAVLKRLKSNNVEMSLLDNFDKRIIGSYRINSFKSNKNPYEGHFEHSDIDVEISMIYRGFKEGDVLISSHQKNRRFIVSVLEPGTPDSYFTWNMFDSYVQQKEHFSSYVFEDKAKEILESNELLRADFEEKKKSDSEFAESAYAQLYFIYKRSKYYEPSHNYLPIHSGMYE